MAVIERLPATAIINGFRGVLDFYVSRGQVIVRAWPRGKAAGDSPGARIYQPVFARANRLKPFIDEPTKVALDRYRVGSILTWADAHVRAYYGKARPNDDPLPPYS